MEFLAKWAVLASVQLAATMSPGPAFVISTRTAVKHGRAQAVFNALGLGLGIGVHIVLVLAGLAFVIAQSPLGFTIVKYAGAAYLMYIGTKALIGVYKSHKAKKLEALDGAVSVNEAVASENPVPEELQFKRKNAFHFILAGFLTNALNPKAVVFFTAVYTQFVDPQTPVEVMALYGLTSMVIEFLWFSAVGIVLTTPAVKAGFMKIMNWVESICGGLMIALGVKLILSKA